MAWIGLVDKASLKIKVVASAGVGKEYLEGIDISVEPAAPYAHGPTSSSLQTVELATTMGEMRDPYTAGHELRMYSIAIKSRGSYLPFPSCANCDSFDIMLNTLKGYTPHRTPRAMPYAHAPCASCNAMPYAYLSHPTPCGNAMRHALCPCGNAAMTYAVTPCPTPCPMPMPYSMHYAGTHHTPCPTHTPCPMLAHTIRHALYPAACHLH